MVTLAVMLFACSDGSDAVVADPSPDTRPATSVGLASDDGGSPSSFTIGGTVTGLVGNVELRVNGADPVVLGADGPFTFPAAIPGGATFLVGVDEQPTNQICVVTNGQGQATVDVTNVAIHCADSRSDLATLELRQGSVPARLTPAFATGATSYIAELHAVSAPTVDLILTTVSKDATVVIDGEPYDPTTPLSYPPLEIGPRTVDIVVTSAAGNAQSHYTVALHAIASYFKPEGIIRTRTGYGYALAASGDRLFVGALNEVDDLAATQGIVSIYRHTGGGWTEEARLGKPATAAASIDQIGQAIATDGDTLVVGTSGGGPLVYRHGAGGWALEQDLTSLFFENESADDASIAISGDSIVLAGTSQDAPHIFAFARTGTTWTRGPGIQAPVEASRRFGTSIVLTNGILYVGAPGGDDDTNGTVYVYELKLVPPWLQWIPGAAIQPPAGDSASSFGASVAVSDSVVVVGAPSESSFGTGVDPPASADVVPNSGAVYMYTTDFKDYTLVHKLKAPVEPGVACPTVCFPELAFGISVDFDGAHLLVAAQGDETMGSGFAVTEGIFDPNAKGSTVRLYSVDASLAITRVAAVRSPNPVCAVRFGSAAVLTSEGFAIADEAESCLGSGVEPPPNVPGGAQTSGAVYSYILP